MATSEGSQRCSPHNAHLYDFCIKFLRITGIRLPFPAKSESSAGSSSDNRQRYSLKITLLHGTEQQKIGEFEVIGDECIINHQLSCQIAFGRPDKLHVYIDQNWSAGLSGHITVDLKEFFDDVDAEIYLEYPLFSSGPSHVRRAARLEMSVLCTCSTKTTVFSDQIDPNQEFMGFEDFSKLQPSLDDHWYPPDLLDPGSSLEPPSMLPHSVHKQVTSANVGLDKIDREIEMLKEMEGDLIELNSKLNKYVAAQSLEKYAPGQYASNISMRPDVLAAVFFSAGMAFQRQVDSMNRLRMYRGPEDSLLPGENSRLLLEDVSPTSRSEASISRETDTFCQASNRSLVLSDSSSNSCGHAQSCSCSSEAATSLGGDIDEDDHDHNYIDSSVSLEGMAMSHLESESVNPRTSENMSAPLGESSTSIEAISLVKNKIDSEPNGRLRKHNVLNVVGSVLSAFTVVGLSGSGSKDHSRGSKDDEATVVGSMLGRQRVTSIKSIRRSNPGLGWLSNSIQFE